MVYLSKTTTWCKVMFSFLVLALLCGCGGGGLKSPTASTTGLTGVVTPSRGGVPYATLASALRIDTYNNWYYQAQDPSYESQKLTLLARGSEICLPEIGFSGVTPAAIKAINPSAHVYRYYNLVSKPVWDTDWKNPSNTSRMSFPLTKAMTDSSDWWLRDGNGNIVWEGTSGSYFDVGKPGFKEAYLTSILTKIGGQHFDGVVLDGWCPTLSDSLISLANKHLPMPAQYPTDQDWYQKAWVPFITYVSDGLRAAGYKVVGNCAGEYSSTNPMFVFQRSKCTGTIYEQWAVDWPQNNGGWLSGSKIRTRIDCLLHDPLAAWTADYGLRTSDPAYAQKATVALAMYYIALPQKQTMLRAYHHYSDGKVYWAPLWSFSIGLPQSAAPTQMANQYFWVREYSKGLVLLNYESSRSATYPLARTYIDYAGNSYSGTVTLAPHTALILASR